MNDMQKTRWMVTFWHSQGDQRTERDFPKIEFWHPDKEVSIAEGKRVLKELISRGDDRDWAVAGHPDPFDVGANRHPGGQWILSIDDVR